MKKYLLSLVFVFMFVFMGSMSTKTAFAKWVDTCSAGPCKVGDCVGGDKLNKNGLWIQDASCGTGGYLMVSDLNSGIGELNWTGFAKSYSLYIYTTSSGSGVPFITKTGLTKKSFTVTGLTLDKTYFYIIGARNDFGESKSAVFSFKAKANPSGKIKAAFIKVIDDVPENTDSNKYIQAILKSISERWGNFVKSPQDGGGTAPAPSTACTSTSSPSITVLSPNGGEVYTDGQQIAIQWTSSGISSGCTVVANLQLYDVNNVSLGAIGISGWPLNLVGAGQALFTLPTLSFIQQANPTLFQNVTFGQHFKILIGDGNNVTNPHASDLSDNFFTINAPAPTSTTGTITIQKKVQLATNSVYAATNNSPAFTFSGPDSSYPNFLLDNNPTSFFLDSKTFTVPAGSYKVKEDQQISGFSLTNLVCSDPTNNSFGGFNNSTTSYDPSTAYINVSAGENVTCTFVNKETVTSSTNYTLYANFEGPGTGSVISSPAGINCTSTAIPNSSAVTKSGVCSATFASGTQVTFSATPSSDSTFSNFDELCNGSTSSGIYPFTMSANRSSCLAFKKIPTSSACTLTPTLITSTSTASQYIAAGNNGVIDATQATFRLQCSSGSATIKELKFSVNGSGTATSVKVNGMSALFINGVAYLTNLNIAVPSGGSGVNINALVSYPTVGINGVPSGTTSQISLTYVKYADMGNNTISTITPSILAPKMMLVGSKPSITVIDSSDQLLNGQVKLAEVKISANTQGNIKVNSIPLSFTALNAQLSNSINSIVIKDANNVTLPTTNTSFGSGGGNSLITLTGGYLIPNSTSQTFKIYVMASSVSGPVGTAYVVTSLGASSSFGWIDVAGNATSAQTTNNTNYFYNYPTNVSTVQN